jgi:hypothetical protein
VYAPIPLKQNQSPTYTSIGTPMFLDIISKPSHVIPNNAEFLVSNTALVSFPYMRE